MDTQEIFDGIVKAAKQPSRADIAKLLSSIAPPGEERELKKQKITDLYAAMPFGGTNLQGHNVVGALDSWEEF